MKIKKDIIDRVNNVRSRRAIGASLDIGDQMIYLHLRRNYENGVLTKMKALIAISKEVGIPVAELIEETDADLVKR